MILAQEWFHNTPVLWLDALRRWARDPRPLTNFPVFLSQIPACNGARASLRVACYSCWYPILEASKSSPCLMSLWGSAFRPDSSRVDRVRP